MILGLILLCKACTISEIKVSGKTVQGDSIQWGFAKENFDSNGLYDLYISTNLRSTNK